MSDIGPGHRVYPIKRQTLFVQNIQVALIKLGEFFKQICLAFDPSRTVLFDAEMEKAVSVQML